MIDYTRRKLLGAAASLLYGDHWQSALAALLDVNDRTVRRWVAGDSAVPDSALAAIADRLAKRRGEIAVMRSRLVKELQR